MNRHEATAPRDKGYEAIRAKMEHVNDALLDYATRLQQAYEQQVNDPPEQAPIVPSAPGDHPA